MTTKEIIEERIEWTSGEHTRWLRYDYDQNAWYNGSNFVCQMSWSDETSDEGEGRIMSWADAYKLEG